MKSILAIAFAAFLVSPASSQPKADAPRAKYKALLKQYSLVSGKIRKATTDQLRKEVVEGMAATPKGFLDLAEAHPKHPIALTALRQAIQAVGSTDSATMRAWEINKSRFPAGLRDGSTARIVKLIGRDHARSDQLGPIIDRLRYGYRMEFEPLLVSLNKNSPHRKLRALAGLALAQFLNDRRRMAMMVQDRPELKPRYAAVFGKRYLAGIKKKAGRKRITSLFEQSAKFGDVDGPRGETVAAIAKSELYELRNLRVGKPAPEIAGKDQDGNDFKLSDYRGKVVLLYFWMEF